MADLKRTKPPTMADVAKLAGVSAMTVSRALKTDSYIKEDTRKKIMQAVDELGYLLDNTAAGLSSRKTGFVAMVIPSINNANFAQTVRGVTDILTKYDQQLLLGSTNYDLEAEEKLVRQLLSRRPEAIILTGSQHLKKCRHLLEKAAIPVFETWEVPEKPIGYSVGYSNYQSSQLVVDHFKEQGAHGLAFMGGDSDADSRGFLRRKGFIAAAEQHNLPSPTLVDLGRAPVSMEQGAEAAKALITSGNLPDAVMCVSDLVAFGFMSECQRAGVHIPTDMLLAGFGDYDISAVSNPTITTINVNAYDMGVQTAKLVIDLLDNDGDQTAPLHKATDMQLIKRQSTGF